MPSSPIKSGMPRRVCAAASMASARRSFKMCKSEPGCFSCTVLMGSTCPFSCSIWPTFSAKVMRVSKSSTRRATGCVASLYSGSVMSGARLAGALVCTTRQCVVYQAAHQLSRGDAGCLHQLGVHGDSGKPGDGVNLVDPQLAVFAQEQVDARHAVALQGLKRT